MGTGGKFWTKGRSIATQVRYTVAPEKFKVSLDPRPMGLIEARRVRKATERAAVPAWLIEADGRATVNDWAGRV